MDLTPVIHVVDDDEGVKESIKFLLETDGCSVQTYADPSSLLATVLPLAGCILTDFYMPTMDGLQLQSRLADLGNRLPFIVMTGQGDIPLAVRAMKAGAIDFLEKPFEPGELQRAVEKALEGNRRALSTAVVTEEAKRKVATLTPRELEVLDQLVVGHSNKEIARILGTSPRTIDVHRARVFQKLNVQSLPDLVRLTLTSRSVPDRDEIVR